MKIINCLLIFYCFFCNCIFCKEEHSPLILSRVPPSWYVGKMHSPIDISDGYALDLVNPKVDFKKSKFYFFVKKADKGIIRLSPADLGAKKKNRVEFQGRVYEIVQINFYIPSEHTVKGHGFDMEVHNLYQDIYGNTIVLCVLVVALEGMENNAFQNILKHVELSEDKKEKDGVIKRFDLRELYPREYDTYRYTGPLVLPPLTLKEVKWMVFKRPVRISPQQLKAFEIILGSNARKIQPRDHWQVILSDTTVDR